MLSNTSIGIKVERSVGRSTLVTVFFRRTGAAAVSTFGTISVDLSPFFSATGEQEARRAIAKEKLMITFFMCIE
ncbi:hypothetical protein D3C86_2003920 [compost metagenome]